MPPIEKTETREIPPLELRASFKPGSVNVEKRTATLVFTTGARVRRGFWEPFDEELSLDTKHVRMERLQSGRAPLLDSHTGYSLRGQIGVIESATLKGEPTVEVRFSKRAEVEPIFQDVVDGIIRNVSVGYRVHKYERVEEGEAQKSGNVPVFRAVDWEPYEVSLVPMPADAGAGVRSAQRSLPLGEQSSNPCSFITRGEEPTTMEPKIETTTPATPPSTPPAPTSLDAAREAKIKEESVIAERVRSSGILTAVRAVKLDDKFAEKLIKDGVSLDEARGKILDAAASADEKVVTDNHVRVEVGDDSSDRFARSGEAWLVERMGIANKLALAEKTEQWQRSARILPKRFGATSFDAGEFRGMTMLDMARECLVRAGVNPRGMDRMTIASRALSTSGPLAKRAGGNYQSTSDFSVLFENVMHKLLLADYALEPDTWSQFCGIETVADFRDHARFRTGALGVLQPIAENGEFESVAFPDGQKTSIGTSTKGYIVGISREAIVNDDMGALAGIVSAAGRAAKRTIEKDVYDLLGLNSGLGPTMSDAQPFFHSNRANVGTAAALSAASLDADGATMAAQKDISDEDFLNLTPAVLLLPRSLRGQAQVINESQFDPDTVANKAQMKPNVVRGMFRTIIGTPRLTGTRRYQFVDPAITPAIVVAFLEGSGQAPTIEQKEGWRTNGVEWRVRQDAEANIFDPKAALTNAGA